MNFLGLPRVAYGLSQHGLAPKAFSKVDDRGTPRKALYFISVWIALLALSGAFELLIRFMMTVAITVGTMVLMGYFKLRRSQPGLERPFTMPGHPVLPAITIALYVGILAILIWTQWQLALGAGAMIGAILLARWITPRRTSGPASTDATDGR